MKMRFVVPAVAFCFIAASVHAGELKILKTDKDRVNYAVGVNIVNTFSQQGVMVDPDMVIRGMRDAFAGKGLLLSDEEIHNSINEYLVQVRQKQAQAAAKAAAENKQAGEEFLSANAKKEGIIVLPSGLQYRIIKTGTGKKPQGRDSVECRYRGTLLSGTEFDSSARSGTVLRVASLVPGWQEALQMMSEGSRWLLFIPPGLAYGERGSGRLIGPNATLIVDVELLAVK